jgi:uncharacterized HAD superfamily protein
MEPQKEPVAQKLRFGIDIDGTITQAPMHFKRLIDALMDNGDTVCIITGRDDGRLVETTAFLKSMCINYDELVMKPTDWPGTMPEWKVKAVIDTDVQLMFDDEEPNCWAIQQQTRCIAAHALPIPEVREEHRDLRREFESRIDKECEGVADIE